MKARSRNVLGDRPRCPMEVPSVRPETPMKNVSLIIILACLSMLGAFSTDTYLPSFPSIAAEFRIGLDVVQQGLSPSTSWRWQ